MSTTMEDLEEMRERAAHLARKASEYALTQSTSPSSADIFGIVIRTSRERLGMDRIGFANYAKIGSGTLEMIELRQMDPRQMNDLLLRKLAHALGMNVEEMLGLCGVTTLIAVN